MCVKLVPEPSTYWSWHVPRRRTRAFFSYRYCNDYALLCSVFAMAFDRCLIKDYLLTYLLMQNFSHLVQGEHFQIWVLNGKRSKKFN